jgi:hypothetical protein
LKLKKTAVLTVNLWAIAFIVVLLCVQLPLYVLSVEDFRAQIIKWVNILANIWYVVLGCAAFANIIAFAEMTRLKRRRRRSTVTGNGKCKIDLIMDRIQRTSFVLVILIIVNAVLVWYQIQGLARTIVSNPLCDVDPYSVALRLSITFRYLALGACLWFIWPIALIRVQKGR